MVSLGYKYSNVYALDAYGISTLMRNSQAQQQEVSAIAHAALHNVFARIDPRFLRLKRPEEHLSDANSLGKRAYRALWRLGYWKKIALIMDTRTGMALMETMGDFEGFQTIFKICSGTTDIFSIMPPHDEGSGLSGLQEQALLFLFRAANRKAAAIQKPDESKWDKKLNVYFPVTGAFWEKLEKWRAVGIASEKAGLELVAVVLKKALPQVKKLLRDKPAKYPFRNETLAAWDAASCVANFMMLLRDPEFKRMNNEVLRNWLSYAEGFALAGGLLEIGVAMAREARFVKFADIILAAFADLQHCTLLSDSWLFSEDRGKSVVHRESPILSDLLGRGVHAAEAKKREAYAHVLKKYGNVANKQQKWVDKKLREEMKEEGAALDSYPRLRLADLEANFLLAPTDWVADIL